MSGLTGRPAAFTHAQHSLETTFLSWQAQNCSPGTRLRAALQRLTLATYYSSEKFISPGLGEISRDFRLLSWKSPGLQVTQVGRSVLWPLVCRFIGFCYR